MPVLNYRDPVDGTFKPLSAGQAIIPAGDFNACTTTGLYSIASNASNGTPNSVSAAIGILQVFAIDATHLTQVWFGGSNIAAPEIWTRSNNAGTWGKWESIIGRINSLGSFDFTGNNGIYTIGGTATSGPGVTGQGLLTVYGNPLSPALAQINCVQTWTSFVTGEIWQRQYSASGAYSTWKNLTKPWLSSWGLLARINMSANVTTSGITEVDLPGLTSTLTYTANRWIRIRVFGVGYALSNTAVAAIAIKEGTQLARGLMQFPVASSGISFAVEVTLSPTAGVHTYVARISQPVGTGTTTAQVGATDPFTMVIEDIGPNGAQP